MKSRRQKTIAKKLHATRFGSIKLSKRVPLNGKANAEKFALKSYGARPRGMSPTVKITTHNGISAERQREIIAENDAEMRRMFAGGGAQVSVAEKVVEIPKIEHIAIAEPKKEKKPRVKAAAKKAPAKAKVKSKGPSAKAAKVLK